MSFLASLFGTDQQSGAATTVLDMVTHITGLASNSSDIDPMLDKVRAITARSGTDSPLSAADEDALFEVYLQIEHYLMTEDPIRTYTSEELRAKLSPELSAQLAEYQNKAQSKV